MYLHSGRRQMQAGYKSQNNWSPGSFTADYWIVKFCDSSSTNIVPENYQNVNAKIYPNPANDELNISMNVNDDYEVTFYDITSKNILHRYFTASIIIDIDKFNKGIYFYEIRNKNKIISKGKIIKI
jgi:hypothetical protein